MSESSPCPTCGACCRSYIVTVCGRDIWRIARHQRLAPGQFVVAVNQEKQRSDGFRLESGGQILMAMLDKQGRFEVKRPCVFLVNLAGDYVTCGVYEHRPVVCRSYPFVNREGGGVALRTKALCPPDGWPQDEALKPSWFTNVRRADFEFDLYSEVVGRWNARVESASGRRFPLDEYYSYLINVYEEIDGIDRTLAANELEQITRTWRMSPEADFDLEELRVNKAEFPWADYLFRVRESVDRYFPEIPPLPIGQFWLEETEGAPATSSSLAADPPSRP